MREDTCSEMISCIKEKTDRGEKLYVSLETSNVDLCLTLRPEWVSDYYDDKMLQIETDNGYFTISYGACDIAFDDYEQEYIIKGDDDTVFTIR